MPRRSAPDATGRADDLLALTRLSSGPQALDAVLDWLARRITAGVAVLRHDGSALTTASAAPVGVGPARAADAVLELCRRGARAGM